jgi:glutamate-5-semialdehyde dehydrogenase
MNLIGQNAKKASLEKINTKLKNKILKRYVSLLDKERNSIIRANAKDLKFALKK